MDMPQPEVKPESFQTREKWFLRWWMVAVWIILFGPFAFPALWKSKEISRFWKWSWTIIVTIITILVIWSSWKMAEIVIGQYQQLNSY